HVQRGYGASLVGPGGHRRRGASHRPPGESPLGPAASRRSGGALCVGGEDSPRARVGAAARRSRHHRRGRVDVARGPSPGVFEVAARRVGPPEALAFLVPLSPSVNPFVRLLRYARPYRGRLTAALLAMIVYGAASVGLVMMVQAILDGQAVARCGTGTRT